MKPVRVFVVTFAALLAAVGATLAYLVRPTEATSGTILKQGGSLATLRRLREKIPHDVTPKMEDDAAKLVAGKPDAPKFDLKAVGGRKVTLGTTAPGRPQFIYFVQDGCPCSVEAEPLYQKLEKTFRDKADFITITDASAKHAYDWVTDMAVRYPVVSRPQKDVMKKYGALSSVYCALVVDGKLVKVWPGYSVDMMKEMADKISVGARIPSRPFDPQYAPKEPTTGCAF